MAAGGGDQAAEMLSLEREERPEIGEDELEDHAPDEGRRADAEEREQAAEMVGERPRKCAETMPSGTPSSDHQTPATKISSSVAGRNWAMSVVTGRLV